VLSAPCSAPASAATERYDREHTFFYADPPYWQTAGYDRAFNWAQYQLLAKVISENKGKITLSINDHSAGAKPVRQAASWPYAISK